MVGFARGLTFGVSLLALVLLRQPADAQDYGYEMVHAFGAYGEPEADLIQGSDGYLYGTTRLGGANSVGSVFRMSTSGAYSTVHSFTYPEGAFPQSGLIQASDGNFYGTTTIGQANAGTVYRIDPAGNFTTIHVFNGPDGANPEAALVQGSNGSLYGTTYAGGDHGYGTVFKIDAAGNFQSLHSFDADADGINPTAPLTQGAGGFFYGTTASTAFKIDDGGNFATLASLPGSTGGLFLAVDGNFYGTTQLGGFAGDTCPAGCGTTFRMDPSGIVTTLHLFSEFDKEPVDGLHQANDGLMYGTTSGGYLGFGSNYGTVFSMDVSGNVVTLYTFAAGPDGRKPLAGVIQATDGFLYGTTSGGPYLGGGTVFRIDTAGALVTLHAYATGEGSDPEAGLIEASDGKFYGTTKCCGTGGAGTVFSLDAAGTVTTLYSFSGPDGASPAASLIQATDGSFYGTAAFGGLTSDPCPDTRGCGTLFKIDAAGTLTTLYVFHGPDGANPLGSLVEGADGNFYGTTAVGGFNERNCATYGCGTVFMVDSSGNLTTLHQFNGSGAGPYGGLVQGVDGFFYGTTASGGASNNGILYRIDASGAFTVLHTFTGDDGLAPFGDLVQASDGNFYGTTLAGGTSGNCQGGCGTVFRMDPSGNVTTLHSFNGDDGSEPQVGLTLGSDGGLYGTTLYGGAAPAGGEGTVYRISISGDFTLLHSLATSGALDGAYAYGKAIQAADGNVYSVASTGGPGNGLIFRVTPCAQSVPITVDSCAVPNAPGLAASIVGNPSYTYAWTLTGGEITSGQGTPAITFTAGTAGTRMELEAFETNTNGCAATSVQFVQVDFSDVPPADPVHPYVCAIGRGGVTAGCGGGSYCRDGSVSRAQMAVLLLKAEHGSDYVPPTCVGVFPDVPCPGAFAVDWIEQLSFEHVTAGCGGGDYCPDAPVTRAQMAPFLLKSKLGSSYTPPPCVGVFADVSCSDSFAPWIEDLYNRNITAGCGSVNYCPGDPTTRGQMAVFLVKTFGF